MRTHKTLILITFLYVGCQTPAKKDAHPITDHYAQGISEKDRQTKEATGAKFVASTQGAGSTQAAIDMIKRGGNIIDAFVAASFAIGVERPHSSGIGGGGFLLYYDARLGKTFAYDFRERAPLRSTKDMFLTSKGDADHKKAENGIHAIAVPGFVDGLIRIHKKYGKLPLATCLEPAIRLAENGIAIYPDLLKALKKKKNILSQFSGSRSLFVKPEGEFQLGEILIQKDLALTMRAIAKSGRNGFYKGPIAEKILQEIKKHGGIIEQKDFDQYSMKVRTPVAGHYKGLTIHSMPPPSSGGVHILQILNIIEKDQLKFMSAETIHLMSSAMQMAFADRAKYLGDSDFVNVPVQGLISKDYAAKLRAEIPEQKARASEDVKPGLPPGVEPDHTTHMSFMDEFGNVVSSTQTINGLFGSGVVAEGTGIVLNNEMDDFAIKVGAHNLFGAIGGDKNLITPLKRPLSTMSPTIVFKDRKPILALGSPSGTRIVSCVAQTLVNYFEFNLGLFDAISVIRFHHQWKPDTIQVDEPGFPDRITSQLKSMGHKIKVDNLNCRVQAVAREENILRGVADPRDAGTAAGL